MTQWDDFVDKVYGLDRLDEPINLDGVTGTPRFENLLEQSSTFRNRGRLLPPVAATWVSSDSVGTITNAQHLRLSKDDTGEVFLALPSDDGWTRPDEEEARLWIAQKCRSVVFEVIQDAQDSGRGMDVVIVDNRKTFGTETRGLLVKVLGLKGGEKALIWIALGQLADDMYQWVVSSPDEARDWGLQYNSSNESVMLVEFIRKRSPQTSPSRVPVGVP